MKASRPPTASSRAYPHPDANRLADFDVPQLIRANSSLGRDVERWQGEGLVDVLDHPAKRGCILAALTEAGRRAARLPP